MDALGLLKEISQRDGVEGPIVTALENAARLLGDEIEAFDSALIHACSDAPAGILEPCRHMMEAGGKRIRPMLCLVAFRAAGGADPLPTDLAIACELLHNATLLHDDVIDEGELRRGLPATRVVYGNAISVLGGDYLLTKTVEIVSKRDAAFMGIFLDTLHQIISGELTQLKRRGSIDTTDEEYFRIIEGKTASLFRFAAHSGTLAAGADPMQCRDLGDFGWHTGIAFQLIDDVLDFTADADRLGKSLLADISEGKMTLPVILASRTSETLRPLLKALASVEDAATVAPQISEAVRKTGAIEEARQRAATHTKLAVDALHRHNGLDQQAAQALEALVNSLLHRDA
ncbi:MAG: polyprenyl synthetase family protein [Myxococcota bacterium]|nr:polyprenyl synthetase family protein [Myxococcota bacterium]